MASARTEQANPLLNKLNLTQKVQLISGASYWTTCPQASIGLGSITFSDGPSGVRGTTWDECSPSTCLPSPTALAATWDEALTMRLGTLLAHEARRKGIHVLLGPNLNLHRSPLGGRHFECFSEDPLLTARIGAAYIRALQAQGVGATPKHFVANDSEAERFTADVRVDERTLREVYLAPFEQAVTVGAWLLMSAYNRVNGVTMTEHSLLRDPLKEEWGFDGVVISDWLAVRSTVAAGNGGNDLAMPGPATAWSDRLVDAVLAGDVPEAIINDKVARLLRLADRVKAFTTDREPDDGLVQQNELKQTLLQQAAASSAVLVRNENGLLPLNPNRLKRIAVIGPNALVAQIQGGGSAAVIPEKTVSPLEDIRERLLPETKVAYAAGVDFGSELPLMPLEMLRNPETRRPGVRVRYLDKDGQVIRIENRQATQLIWLDDGLVDVDLIEIETCLRVLEPGIYRIGVGGNGAIRSPGTYRLAADEQILVDEVIDNHESGQPGTAVPAAPGTGEVELHQDQEIAIRLSHQIKSGAIGVPTGVTLSLLLGRAQTHEEALAAAVDVARDADVAILIVGTTNYDESEGADRATMTLPRRQNELINKIAAVNKRTVVVLNTGAPVEIPWHKAVDALLLCWFPGQEGGKALADILFGAREPGGRLPTTWATSESDVPVLVTQPQDNQLVYAEGLHIGYRAWARTKVKPAYYFGHGLGYTEWQLHALKVPDTASLTSPITVQVRLANVGLRPGREVVQVYLQRKLSVIDRPIIWLAGFCGVQADPGHGVTAEIHISPRSFQHWSEQSHSWETETGTFTILAGRSAGDLPLSAPVTIRSS